MILSCPDPAADPCFAAELLRLQHAAYRVEAGIVGDNRLPPLTADESDVAAWRGHLLVAWEATHLLGAVAWSEREDVMEVDRLMVDPAAHRRGVATTLLAHVLERGGSRDVDVSTGRDNAPAVALYRGHGFEPVGDEQAPTGLWLTHLRRRSEG